MVQYIEELGSEIQVYPFRDRRVFRDREVELFERRPAKRVPSQIAEVARTRNTVRLTRVVWNGIDRPSTWSRERSQFEEVVWETPVMNRRDHVRPVKTLPCAGVVPFEEI